MRCRPMEAISWASCSSSPHSAALRSGPDVHASMRLISSCRHTTHGGDGYSNHRNHQYLAAHSEAVTHSPRHGRAPQSPPCYEGSASAQTHGGFSPHAPSSAGPLSPPATAGAPVGRSAGQSHTALPTSAGHETGVLSPTGTHTHTYC